MIPSFLTDSRTEWAVRFTVLHAIFYVLFFYPPSTSFYLDWSLPVQLISGGNLAFYNAGWHAWFGLGCAFAMTAAGAILTAIFPLLQDDNLPVAFVCLMAFVLALVTPFLMDNYIGVLNNLRSIGIILVIIFLEVFYGPLLNFRSVFDTKAIWTEVVGPNAIPALAYAAISWLVYAIPPWHSATYQMLHLSSQVVGGVGECLQGAAGLLRSVNAPPKAEEGEEQPQQEASQPSKAAFRAIANGLLQQTSYAGLYVPISLYGDMGIYETSIFYPSLSLRADAFQTLGRQVDRTVYHVALVLWALGEAVEHLESTEDGRQALQQAAADQMTAASKLANAIASVLACPRKTYRQTEIDTSLEGLRSSVRDSTRKSTTSSASSGSIRENIVTNPLLFDAVTSSDAKRAASTVSAKQDLFRAAKLCDQRSANWKDTALSFKNDDPFVSHLLYAITADLTTGQRPLVHFEDAAKDKHSYRPIDPERGSLGRLQAVAETLQDSWTDDSAWPRMLYRLLFLEQIQDLFFAWLDGIGKMVSGRLVQPHIQGKRTMGRFLQYIVGTLGLYAMATWWKEYSSLLGSSSTGQWTMVSFYVCFRATADETIHAGLLRSIGHGLGAMLSWGINTAVTSNGGRIGCHLAFTFVGTWLIPPPFSVAPSAFNFGGVDILTTNLLEGLLTTYHLTSVLVLSTDIESATKARAISQCIGAGAAVVVTFLIMPWFARPQAQRTLAGFRDHCKRSLSTLGGSSAANTGAIAYVERLLQARRDVSSAEEAAGWVSALFGAKGDDDLGESLTQAAFGALAVEGIVERVNNEGKAIPETVLTALKENRIDDALSAIRDAICDSESTETQQSLALLYLEVLLLRESLMAN